MFQCFNVHVQTCSSFITSKRCREDSLNLPMSVSTTTTNKKKNQGITFGLWLLSALSPSKVFLTCISDSYANETKNTALEGKTHLFKECTFKLLREIVEAPSWFLVSISCLCLKFHVVTCKKAECNLTWFCFVAISYNVAVVLWQSMKFYTKLFIVSVGSKAQISLGFKLSCF